MKLKIYELSTGTFRHACMPGSFDHCEQWTFLPKNAWYSRMVLNERMTQFHKNFCLLYFYRGEFGHFLLMNLVTRVQFWIERDEIEEQIKAAAPDFNLDDEVCCEILIGEMKVGTDKIEVSYQVGDKYINDELLYLSEFNIQ